MSRLIGLMGIPRTAVVSIPTTHGSDTATIVDDLKIVAILAVSKRVISVPSVTIR